MVDLRVEMSLPSTTKGVFVGVSSATSALACMGLRPTVVLVVAYAFRQHLQASSRATP